MLQQKYCATGPGHGEFSGEACPLHQRLSPGVQLRALEEDVPVSGPQ